MPRKPVFLLLVNVRGNEIYQETLHIWVASSINVFRNFDNCWKRHIAAIGRLSLTAFRRSWRTSGRLPAKNIIDFGIHIEA